MQKLTKVCYILPEYNPDTDSHFYHLYELLENLSNRLDIFLIVERSRAKNIKLGNKVYVQKFRFLPLRFVESFLIILWARILGYRNFYTHYCYIGGANAGIISRLFGGKSYYWNCAMNWLFKQKTFSKIGFKLCLKLANFLVTCSQTMKEEHIKHYGLNTDKIKVMPNWVSLDRFKRQETPAAARKAKSKKQRKTLLFVHWLAERKGAHLLVPIIKELSHHLPSVTRNLRLLIVGEGPYKDKLLKEIKENKLDKFIKFLGKVPNREITRCYAMTDIFIMPSRKEAFGRVLLEAMAMGIPYVAFDIGSAREISPPAAHRFLVKPGDIEKFAYKIDVLISNKEIYNKFRKEELERVKEYSLEKTIDRFIKLFS
jgi:glycosyltransferase involved in cell wall biosynthesis